MRALPKSKKSTTEERKKGRTTKRNGGRDEKKEDRNELGKNCKDARDFLTRKWAEKWVTGEGGRHMRAANFWIS